jgi:putative PIG3 family NAD(P)H quinone oxidoreductase
MKAITINVKKKLTLTNIPAPSPAADELLIKVEYAGVSRPDIMQAKGLYPAPSNTPEYAKNIPGLEISGKIIAIGEKISRTNFTIGQTICALATGGGYAEYICVKAAQSLAVPENITMAEAAGLPESFFTVWSNIFDLGKLKQGETILIHGGTSGIGCAAIQFAKAYGAAVITTAGSPEKIALCSKLGADLAINYKTEDFEEEILKFTNGKGVNLILDIIAGDYTNKNLKSLSIEGRLVMIAVQNGSKIEANILPIMLKRLTFTGSTLRGREDGFKNEIAEKLLKEIWPKLISGEIIPQISKIFPLEDAQSAHDFLNSGENMGKVTLKINPAE